MPRVAYDSRVDDLSGIARGELRPALSAADAGDPASVLEPATTDEVRRIVLHARKARTPVVVVGSRTAYFDNLALTGAIAVDVRRLVDVAIDDANAVVTSGAGISVAALDGLLRARGSCIPMRPDGYGDETIGSLVAHDTSAGVGAFHGPFSERLVGLEVVTGAGDVVRTGAARVLGSRAGMRQGLPDLGALFLAAEGRFGIVTAVAFQLRPARARVRMRGTVGFDADGVARFLAAVRAVRFSNALDTIALEHDRGNAAASLTILAHPHGAKDLAVRLSLGEPEEVPATDGAFRGPPERHRESLAETFMDGVDVHVGWDETDWIVEVAERIGAHRTTIYPGPHAVNVGMHFHFPRIADGAVAARAACASVVEALSGIAAIPYRSGRRWRASLRLDPGYETTLRAIAAVLDPDGILNPGVGAIA